MLAVVEVGVKPISTKGPWASMAFLNEGITLLNMHRKAPLLR